MHIRQTLYKVWLTLADEGEFRMHSGKSRHKAEQEYQLYLQQFDASRVRWEETFE